MTTLVILSWWLHIYDYPMASLPNLNTLTTFSFQCMNKDNGTAMNTLKSFQLTNSALSGLAHCFGKCCHFCTNDLVFRWWTDIGLERQIVPSSFINHPLLNVISAWCCGRFCLSLGYVWWKCWTRASISHSSTYRNINQIVTALQVHWQQYRNSCSEMGIDEWLFRYIFLKRNKEVMSKSWNTHWI